MFLRNMILYQIKQRSNIRNHQPVKHSKGANAMTNNTHNTTLKMKRRFLLTHDKLLLQDNDRNT